MWTDNGSRTSIKSFIRADETLLSRSARYTDAFILSVGMTGAALDLEIGGC